METKRENAESVMHENYTLAAMLEKAEAERDAALSVQKQLVEALEEIRSDCQVPIDEYHKNGPQWTLASGAEHCDQSYVLEKMAELIAACDGAILAAKASS